MKKYIINIILVITALMLVPSCQDLTEVNENPNAIEPDQSDPNILITTVLSEISNQYIDGLGYGLFAGVMQHCQKDAWFSSFNDYDWSSESWEDYYGILRTNELLLHVSEQNEEYYSFHHGVGLIMKAFIFGLITDTWGDCPYSQALQGNGEITTPAYDSQKDVYLGVINTLKEAIPYLKASKGIEANADIFYHGDAEKWKKFANALLLRYYMRVSNKMPSFAEKGFAEVVNSGMIFTGNDDNAAAAYPGNNMEDSWPYNIVYDDTQGSNYRRIKACDTFTDELKALGDPRIHEWFNMVEVSTKLSDTVTVNGATYEIDGKMIRFFNPDSIDVASVDTSSDYVGIPPSLQFPQNYNLNPEGSQNSFNKYVSFLNDQFKEPKGDFLKARIITYSEVNFLLAEAVLKSWIGGNAEDYYNEAINASFDMWGIAGIDEYLLHDGVKWGTGSWDGPLEQLINQKWIASWTYQHEAWLDYLRTGYPKLSTGPNAVRDHIPYRFMYGSDESSYNTENYSAAVGRLEMTTYSQGIQDSPWSKPWLYQSGIDEP